MPENPKVFIHGTLVELCTRTEQGLPFAPTPYIRLIWLSILARAQTMYPLTICHALLMANHVHLLVIIQNPAHVPKFVEYLKRELAHAVNHLLGNPRATVWEEGYDSPVILDAAKAIERIAYCYANCSEAALAQSIDDYPNWSTWSDFLSAAPTEITVPRIARNDIPELPLKTLSFAEQEDFARELEAKGKEHYVLRIEPDAWMKCFSDELAGTTAEQNNELVVKRIREKEADAKKNRNGPVVGAHALRLQSMRRQYRPTKRGKKMLCLASFVSRRKRYVGWFKQQLFRIKEAKLLSLPALWRAARPPGFFMPGGFLCASVNPAFVPLA